ncbi:hypothetical protein Pyn_04052 [Prunus yedoensis var. nudiflora]|uniref:Uncharacterized protein n=1 Tax=Prunus yedoensis var. nudiflora TaxID=2094558 RepID=A0A314UHN6_PRUYE|nr:hypothetical protein Pyn_04052 [Prunus yedoensis var. nudiflora]
MKGETWQNWREAIRVSWEGGASSGYKRGVSPTHYLTPHLEGASITSHPWNSSISSSIPPSLPVFFFWQVIPEFDEAFFKLPENCSNHQLLLPHLFLSPQQILSKFLLPLL